MAYQFYIMAIEKSSNIPSSRVEEAIKHALLSIAARLVVCECALLQEVSMCTYGLVMTETALICQAKLCILSSSEHSISGGSDNIHSVSKLSSYR